MATDSILKPKVSYDDEVEKGGVTEFKDSHEKVNLTHEDIISAPFYYDGKNNTRDIFNNCVRNGFNVIPNEFDGNQIILLELEDGMTLKDWIKDKPILHGLDCRIGAQMMTQYNKSRIMLTKQTKLDSSHDFISAPTSILKYITFDFREYSKDIIYMDGYHGQWIINLEDRYYIFTSDGYKCYDYEGVMKKCIKAFYEWINLYLKKNIDEIDENAIASMKISLAELLNLNFLVKGIKLIVYNSTKLGLIPKETKEFRIDKDQNIS